MTEIFGREAAAGAVIPVPDSGTGYLDSDSVDWQESGTPGFLIKPLMEDANKGLRSWLMRVEPGASCEMHAHAEVEQIYVLEGSFHDQDGSYRAGDYLVRAAGAMHTAGSDSGAVVLLFYSPAS